MGTDLVLKTDPKFREFAELYARDQNAFFKDFAKAFSKLLHLGCKNAPENDDDEPLPTAKQQASELFLENAMHGSLKRMQELEKQADVHYLEKKSGRSALHKAAFWGHVATVKYLIETCKLEPNCQDYNGDTALHDAAKFGHMEIVHILAPVTDLSLKNKNGLTSEALAAQAGKYELAGAIQAKL